MAKEAVTPPVVGSVRKEMYGNLPIRTAFSHANDILTIAAKGIAEIITYPGYINVDFEDVKTVMRNSGVALMGSASAEGENRAMDAVQGALASPLLNDNQILGAKNILLNISFGSNEVLMDEIDIISNFIQEQAGLNADVIFGTSIDETLGDKLAVTIICTGFESRENKITYAQNIEAKVPTKHVLYDAPSKPQMIVANPLADVVKTLEPTIEPEAEIKIEPIVDVINEPIATINTVEETPAVEDEMVRFVLEDEVAVVANIEQDITEEIEMPLAEMEVEMPEAETPQEPFLKTIAPVINEIDLPELNDELMETPPADYSNFVDEVEESMTFNAADDFDFELKEEVNANTVDQEDRINKSIARLKKIKELNLQINTPVGLRDLEKEPAYVRRQKKLNEVPHSSENAVSRLSLFDDGTNNGIRTNNSFLHDNVD
jgi:cell division protein FtsZ